MKPAVKLIISIAIPLAIGAIASLFTSASVNGWYTTIYKPSFNPPNWIFAPVWTGLYIMMGIAFYLIWKSHPDENVKNRAIDLYLLQLAFNFLWSFIFFYLHQPGWALVDIIALWIAILLTIVSFGKISVTAAWLLLPYICWVSFAAILNFFIWKMN